MKWVSRKCRITRHDERPYMRHFSCAEPLLPEFMSRPGRRMLYDHWYMKILNSR
jgi:hypothetical protein